MYNITPHCNIASLICRQPMLFSGYTVQCFASWYLIWGCMYLIFTHLWEILQFCDIATDSIKATPKVSHRKSLLLFTTKVITWVQWRCQVAKARFTSSLRSNVFLCWTSIPISAEVIFAFNLKNAEMSQNKFYYVGLLATVCVMCVI